QGEWDESRLEQVFSNLLSNAVHHGAPGEPVVVRTRGENGTVLLEVVNRGEPIAPDLLPRLFEPLKGTAGEDRASARRRSVGLGLFIVKRVADAHGGDVRITSSAEAGTTVSVRLPRTAGTTGEAGGPRRARFSR
ncbi:MAG TPA: ATP-binding protein, partial [Myxococcales bacterium]|nr:ATP-binding protein [Myxococcales bacterium]